MTKKYICIGEAFQAIKPLQNKNEVFKKLQWNWGKIFDPSFVPNKYIEKTSTLIINSPHPVVYVEYLAEEIKEKCNAFLGFEGVKKVKFLQG